MERLQWPTTSVRSILHLAYFPLVPIVMALVATLVTFLLYRRHPPFPPGPKGLPILGNIFDIPLKSEAQTYYQWAKRYGPIVSVHVLGQRIVFLNSFELTRELFDSRSSIYSNRPAVSMLHLMGYGKFIVGLLNPDNEQWKQGRKLFSQSLNSTKLQMWRPYQLQEIHRLLANLLDKPEDFYHLADRATVGSVMRILYGHHVPAYEDDDLVAMHDKSERDTILAITNGAYLVNTFPILRHIPAWVPGARFKRQANEGYITGQQILHEPMKVIKQKMATGEAVPCYVTNLLEDGQDEFLIKQCAATAYNAGIGTARSVLHTVFLVLTLYPEVQRKGQEEIDRVIGGDRLPQFNDRLSLPYTEAIVKEVFRWGHPGPLGLPHLLTKDDVVQGYYLPAGTMIMSNVWGTLHDETRYPKPFDFIPERYLASEGHPPEPNPMDDSFGFGKRACPGRHFSEAFLWASLSSILATLNITKKITDDGQVLTPIGDFTPGFMSGPEPFKCTIKPRSEAAVALIRFANNQTP